MTDLLAGRDRVDSPLGAGGMGEVFLAHDLRLERRVAIKWLHPDHEQDLVARERLRKSRLDLRFCTRDCLRRWEITRAAWNIFCC